MTEVVIVVEGGVVQDVFCDNHVRVKLIDHDNGNEDEAERYCVLPTSRLTKLDADVRVALDDLDVL